MPLPCQMPLACRMPHAYQMPMTCRKSMVCPMSLACLDAHGLLYTTALREKKSKDSNPTPDVEILSGGGMMEMCMPECSWQDHSDNSKNRKHPPADLHFIGEDGAEAARMIEERMERDFKQFGYMKGVYAGPPARRACGLTGAPAARGG